MSRLQTGQLAEKSRLVTVDREIEPFANGSIGLKKAVW
jgi:hypothetical protein